ncbi:hypothetical protein Val02_09210 [Virgisporangium aliadipatigenens]|uniref:Uncharacterized protein n=1 Tax=Virgisporangium aliadipatigenens TaxID=741659 RepID=A0A8J4DMQ6_9ACTN|nr:hypothetical protein [Virgisporangium aliadipatigenens]GIJ44035.1 hypothetical protein Val02_09210 [Virgisporangium aliadipatigenens]
MTEALTPRWQEADEAVESLVATLVALATAPPTRAARKRPGGRPRAKSRPKSTRHHIAEVIRRYRLAPGLRVDRNMVAALLIGHRDLVTNPVLVAAVARACGIITGRELSPKKVARMAAESARVAALLARAEGEPTPGAEAVVPAPRRPIGVAVRPSVRARKRSRRRARARAVRRWSLAAAGLLLLIAVVLLLG